MFECFFLSELKDICIESAYLAKTELINAEAMMHSALVLCCGVTNAVA